MILRHHCGLVLLIIAYFTTVAYTDVLDADDATILKRFKRDYQDDPKAYLDQVINYWIFRIPILIDIAVAQSEKDLTLTVAKRVTQGWSIVIASWKDILSDYVENDRTLGNLGDMTVVYNYGFLATYGIGFGFPLLLGLPDDKKSCGRDDFVNTLAQYDLQGGISPLLYRADLADIQSILIEFELIIGTKLSCIDSAENIESQVVINAVSNLIAAMAARLELAASEYGRSSHHVERKLDVNEEESSSTIAEETPPSLLAEPSSLLAEKAAQIISSPI